MNKSILLQYKESALVFMQMPESWTVKNGTTWNYEYFLRDHLGNTRAVFAYTNKIDEYKATMEPALATTEESLFQNLPASRLQMATYNHTPKSYQTPSPDRVAETNGYTGKTVGPAKLLQVRSGDQITAQAYARYTTGTGGSTAVVNTLLAAVTGAFGLTSGESGYTAFSNNLGTIAGGLTANSSVPKSYLIYILFKSDYSAYQFGYQMVSVAAQAGPELLTTTVTVPSAYDNGYLYIYIADESNVASASSVYFDDVYIMNVEAALALQVTQATDYYLFGMTINPSIYQKNVTYKNKWKFQKQEHIDDFGLNWDQFKWRNYQATIGRFFNVDPLASKYVQNSPYAFSENKVVSHIELEGLESLQITIPINPVHDENKKTWQIQFIPIDGTKIQFNHTPGSFEIEGTKTETTSTVGQYKIINALVGTAGGPTPIKLNASTATPKDIENQMKAMTGKIIAQSIRNAPLNQRLAGRTQETKKEEPKKQEPKQQETKKQ